MHVEKEVNAESGSVVKCEEAEAMLKRTVSLQQIINERVKRVEEFQKLGASQRRVVTNLVNEMRLRLHFLGTPFDNFVKKKAWIEIRLLRDICLCCKKMLQVFIQEKMQRDYFSLKPRSFGLVAVTESLLNETAYAAFEIHRQCEEMSEQNLCLLYRVSLYVLPKIKIIGQPTHEDEIILREFIDMQKR